jgi:hypothetical protein
MITTRPELLDTIIKLSHFATNPAAIHYDAVYDILQYLSGTRDDGLTYTCPKPLTWGPVVKHTPLQYQPTNRIHSCIEYIIVRHWSLWSFHPCRAWRTPSTPTCGDDRV